MLPRLTMVRVQGACGVTAALASVTVACEHIATPDLVTVPGDGNLALVLPAAILRMVRSGRELRARLPLQRLGASLDAFQESQALRRIRPLITRALGITFTGVRVAMLRRHQGNRHDSRLRQSLAVPQRFAQVGLPRRGVVGASPRAVRWGLANANPVVVVGVFYLERLGARRTNDRHTAPHRQVLTRLRAGATSAVFEGLNASQKRSAATSTYALSQFRHTRHFIRTVRVGTVSDSRGLSR
jgi:hypothetical protein